MPGTVALEYAPRGLVGVLTPQANTTVEPEFRILTPPGYASIAGRLTSARTTIEARLVDYFDGMETSLGQFGNAPLGAVAFACTGSSYLAGIAREDAVVAVLSERLGVPVITAAGAVVDALRALGARRIALVSAYDAALNAASARYWTARGFTIVAKAGAVPSAGLHPIYGIGAREAAVALATLDGADTDAIVLLGTGMPTLGAIAARAGGRGPPVVSCMLCLVWAAIAALDRRTPDAADLRAWIAGDAWRGAVGPASA